MMSAEALVSPEEYIRTDFGEREPEFIQGQLLEKPMPDILHGIVQAQLTVQLAMLLGRHGLSG